MPLDFFWVYFEHMEYFREHKSAKLVWSISIYLFNEFQRVLQHSRGVISSRDPKNGWLGIAKPLTVCTSPVMWCEWFRISTHGAAYRALGYCLNVLYAPPPLRFLDLSNPLVKCFQTNGTRAGIGLHNWYGPISEHRMIHSEELLTDSSLGLSTLLRRLLD